jgi:putative flippase GtrA
MGLTPELEAVPVAAAERVNVLEAVLRRVLEHSTLLKFAAVGATGYIIYQIAFLVLYESGVVWFLPDKEQSVSLLGISHGDSRLLITTLIAAELSIIGVFGGHHHWTFREREVDGKALWLRFSQFNLKAAVSSLGILNLVVNVMILSLDVSSYIAIPIGVATAFAWNWIWDSRFIWRPLGRRGSRA